MLKILKLGNLVVVLNSLLIMTTSLLILNHSIISIYALGAGLLVGLVAFCWGLKEIKFFEKLTRLRLLGDHEKWVCLLGILSSNFLIVLSSLFLMGIIKDEIGFVNAYYPILVGSYPLGLFLIFKSLWSLEVVSVEEYLYN